MRKVNHFDELAIDVERTALANVTSINHVAFFPYPGFWR
jgi:hypothetical protein